MWIVHIDSVSVSLTNDNSTDAMWIFVKSETVNYEGWNFNFGNTPLDWIQELLE